MGVVLCIRFTFIVKQYLFHKKTIIYDIQQIVNDMDGNTMKEQMDPRKQVDIITTTTAITNAGTPQMFSQRRMFP